jgi:hypothetical protein
MVDPRVQPHVEPVTTHQNNQKFHPTPGQDPLASSTCKAPAAVHSGANSPDGEHTRLRAAMVAMDSEVSHRADSAGLLASWAALVEILAVEKEPAVRPCPFCGVMVMRDATRCRDCWKTFAKA